MENDVLQKLPGIKENISLKNFTTYKIGGPAKYFFVAKTKDDLMEILSAAKKNRLAVFILGGGSNLLISDKGFKGLVIKIDISDIEIKKNKAIVGAGAGLTRLSQLLSDNGLSGLEWAVGVPGTVGGAIYGNAQAFGTKICDAVEKVEAVNLKTLKFKKFTKKQCRFSLKKSIFKKNRSWVIVSAVLNFKKDGSEKIKDRIKEFLNYRKTHHPIDMPSAGSTFVNPQIKIKDKKLLMGFPELISYNKIGIIPAGFLIAKAGLAGKKAGNAQISEKHANFIVNLGGANAEDILFLMKLAAEKVKNKFNIVLEPEVQLVGFKK
jgi:UDP-N-acetylmuramate dehydrogenase